MLVIFGQKYLQELYEQGKCCDKKHRFQPQIVKKYIRTIDLMRRVANVLALSEYGGLHYEHIKKGCRLSESTTNIALCSMKFYKVSKQLPKL